MPPPDSWITTETQRARRAAKRGRFDGAPSGYLEEKAKPISQKGSGAREFLIFDFGCFAQIDVSCWAVPVSVSGVCRELDFFVQKSFGWRGSSMSAAWNRGD